MESASGHDFTAAELKDALRERGLPTSGAKSELIKRLNENDPSTWRELEARRRSARFRVDSGSGGVRRSTEDGETAGACAAGGEARAQGEPSDVAACEMEAREDAMRREIELLRREKECAEREQQLLRRELEMLRNSPATVSSDSVPVLGNVKSMKELLPEFDGTNNAFERWRQQLRLLKRSYHLDEDSTRVLISSRLKGRALSWFYSRAEYITMGVEELLGEMERMFDLRPRKLELKREFEARVWRGGETFCDYYHEKMILANRIPIAEDEIIDYLIEGVTDRQLRSQARLMNYKTAAELLEAFAKVEVDNRRTNDVRARRDGVRVTDGGGKETPPTTERARRCHRCHEVGHIAAHCKQKLKRACYVCESTEHLARECPKRNQSATAGAFRDIARTTSTNVIQPAELPKPCMIRVRISVKNAIDELCNYFVEAVIDSGSPISLVRGDVIRDELRLLEGGVHQFHGINGSRLRVDGMFHGVLGVSGVRMEMKFYVVPRDTMAYDVLLGRDFLSCPQICVTFGETFRVTGAEEARAIDQLMHINSDDFAHSGDELKVNPAVGECVSARIHKVLESDYLANFEREKCVPDFEMIIALKHEQPISSRPRRLSFADKEILQEILDELLKRTVIRPSCSPYASPIVLAKKKDGSYRLCVDYRELNKITIRDNFPAALIDDNIDQLRDKAYFSILDLKDGFHHVKMSEASIRYTSFVTPLGQFEYLCMPFGLTNAPRVFQLFVCTVFEPLIRRNKILIYLDDLLIATKCMDEHIEILSEVFEIAGRHHLRFRFDKCCFAQTEIKYLGYCVNRDGVRPSDENVEAVLEYPIPRNSKDTQRFLGLESYFRRFVPGFSTLAKPLYELMKKNAAFRFGPSEGSAFEALKRCLSSGPVLAIYSPRAETELHCDASASGYGGILLQKQSDNMWRPVSFWSQRTTPAETKYHSFELECLAVVYALKRFRIYLAGRRFRIVTDCDSFRLTLSKRDVNPRISRWALFLQNYDYEIVHRPGKKMGHVDALSRCHGILVLEGSTLERTLSVCQDRDEEIVKIRKRLEEGDVKYYELRDGLVYRKDRYKKLLFYVPRLMESNVIRTCHDDLGHVGIDKVVEGITRVYWFPRMREKVREYILDCLKCIEFSPSSGKAEGYLHSISKEGLPFSTIHVDHLGPLEKTGKGYRYLLVIIDAFTKFIRIYPCKSTTTGEALRHLCDYFRAYSRPRRLISDRGTCFTSDAFKDHLKSEAIEHVLVAVGTPRANGQVERFNRVITPMLAKLTETPSKWDRVLDQVEFSVNNTVCRTTGETPARLLFGLGQHGKPNDLLRDIVNKNVEEDRSLDSLRKSAQDRMDEAQNKSAERYNLRRKAARRYKVGDYVEIRNMEAAVGVNKKLVPKYKGPYIVKKVLDRDRYVVVDVDGFQLTQRPYTGILAPDQMRPYIRM